ncbi:hypothetical protein ACFVXE_32345 [Streptomyces sp. NPDC058231]|uniref:hypothetical protein n=1 Tax=Streptomyces sp. NPDC058231 TaxID=3346392 RepID=UPI0036E04569
MPDGRDVIVGRRDIDTYVAFPADGAELLRRLQAGADLEEAGRWYRDRYGETIDMADFLETLRELQFIRSPEEPDAPAAREQLSWQRLGRIVYSWPAWSLYVGICTWAVLLTAHHPSLRPRYESFFFTPSLLLTELGLFFGQLPGIFFHEAFHALAGRRLGVPTRLGLGNRLYILVFETDLNALWGVPRRSRYLPLLAGMVADMIWWSALTILAGLTGPHTFPGTLFLALALSTLLRLAWQFYFYLRTDVYQVLVTALRCVDLHRTTKEYLGNRTRRLFRRPARHDEGLWHPRDRQVARWYVHAFGLGYLFTLSVLAWFVVPLMMQVASGIAARLLTGAALSPQFLDGCLALLLNLVPPATVAVMVLRRRRARRTAN